jgi:outer membrane receptor protein involved in Fe transport
MNIIIPLLLFCFFATTAIAEDAVYALPESLVQGEEAENNERMLEIKSSDWEGKNLSLADVLATYAGIQTRSMGGMGSFQSISIRGMPGKQIALAIDGVVLQSFGAADLGSIDLNQYEKVEVYKGFIPAKFAANGMGGVINLVSKDAAAKGGKFYASYGSHNSRILSMQASSPLADSLFWTSNINYRASNNDFPYLNRNGTQYNTEDDFWTRRENADYSQISGNHSWTFVQKRNIVLRAEHHSEEGGISGREYQVLKTARSANDAFLASLEIEPKDKNFDFGFQGFAGIEKSMSVWHEPIDKMGYAQEERTQSGLLAKNGGGQGSFYFENNILKTELHAYLSYQYLESRNNSVILSDYELSNTVFQASFAGTFAPIDFFNIRANAASRHSRQKLESGYVRTFYMDGEFKEGSRDLHSGRASANIGKADSRWSSFFAFGHYFRDPSVFELFSTAFGLVSNPNLKPEQGEQMEAGIGYKTKKSRLSATLFENWIRDRIIYHTSGMVTKPINAEAGKVYGIEAELASELFSWLKINANATFQSPENLPNEPEQQYYSSVLLVLPYSFELTLDGEAHGEFYRDKAQRKKIPVNSFYHAGLGYKPSPKTKLFFYARNLSGGEYQNIYDAYPTPGRMFSLSYSHSF